MSLNQKYTWQDFLKEHPEHKEKGTKRTSSEGKKAFESAYKAYVKKYLSERSEKADKLIEKAKTKRTGLVTKSKDLKKAKSTKKLNLTNKKIGKVDAAIARHERFKDKNKTVQKNFK